RAIGGNMRRNDPPPMTAPSEMSPLADPATGGQGGHPSAASRPGPPAEPRPGPRAERSPEPSLAEIAAGFALPSPVLSVEPLGNGIVNSTYLVRLGDGSATVLQRLNTAVFRQPRLVMGNMQRVTRHIRQRVAAGAELLNGRRWSTPEVVACRSGGDPWQELDGGFWRMLTYLPDSDSLDTVSDAGQAQEIGLALGTFHSLISDLPASSLADTLEGFHITPRYLEQHRQVLAAPRPRPDPAGLGPGEEALQWALAFVREREGGVAVLEQAREAGRLRPRPIHGDPKVNNVLLERGSGRAFALVDLDTVKPGLIHYDIGDCLRSVANPLGEETADWTAVHFDPQLAAAVLQGYGSVARSFLSDDDRAFLFEAARLIAFELGLRFLSDHLAGDVYFRCDSPGHNLRRALVQLQLSASIEAQESTIRDAVASMG
ncbi:MAG: phosphotransferase, partial [Synechococcaceae cyanobacterium]|nr:phosphotransferase [Synechococcaceae cyanobacterium]